MSDPKDGPPPAADSDATVKPDDLAATTKPYDIALNRARPARAKGSAADGLTAEAAVAPTEAVILPEPDILSPTRVAEDMERSVRTAMVAHLPHLSDVVELSPRPMDELGVGKGVVMVQPILILIQSLRANSKVFITLRDDQRAAWSEGSGRGLVGFSLSSLKDPTIYMRSFLINSREIYLQSYRACEELQCQLYVRTTQREVRGRVDLPPGATVTFQTGIDRLSVVGLSSFAVEFPPAG